MEISELNQQMCHGKRFFTMDSSGVVAVCRFSCLYASDYNMEMKCLVLYCGYFACPKLAV